MPRRETKRIKATMPYRTIHRAAVDFADFHASTVDGRDFLKAWHSAYAGFKSGARWGALSPSRTPARSRRKAK